MDLIATILQNPQIAKMYGITVNPKTIMDMNKALNDPQMIEKSITATCNVAGLDQDQTTIFIHSFLKKTPLEKVIEATGKTAEDINTIHDTAMEKLKAYLPK